MAPSPGVARAWLALWCTWTALLRPLSGASGFEVLERAGNYGVPLALLLSHTPATTLRGWFEPMATRVVSSQLGIVKWTLRCTVSLLLVGHGGLAMGEGPLVAAHWAWLGVADPAAVAFWSGAFEVALGAAVLARPVGALLLLALAWKLATELLFPLSGDSVFEFIERGGSYGAPLALYLVQRTQAREEAQS